jgi:hypothetical protein
MILKLSMIAAVLVSVSAHAGLQCERAKREMTLNGQAHVERIVNVRQNGAVVYSKNFDTEEAYRNRAADACAQALADSSCSDLWVDEIPDRWESDGLGRGIVKGIPAHMGSKNSVTGGVYINRDACEHSRIELATDAIDAVRTQLRRQRSREAALRRLQAEANGWGPKI